jgi:two-component system sensor histidine kinase UhpB
MPIPAPSLSLSPQRQPVLDLPRLVMRRALTVSVVALLAACVLGFVRAGMDIDDETRSAIALAGALIRVADAPALPDAELLDTLGALQRDGRLRHLSITVRDGEGRVLLAPPAPQGAGWLTPLVRLHAAWQGPGEAHELSWPIARAQGRRWMMTLAATRDSERREAMAGVALTLVGAVAGVLALLAALAWQLQRAFAPLKSLLEGIERLEHGEPGAAAALPAMPIRELQSIAAALRRLDDALQGAELQRRLLGQKVLTLQEDERGRLAQELHDEFGQRLTALRVDAAWLRGQLTQHAAPDALVPVVDGMDAQCRHIQHDIRSLLTRLRPLGAETGEAAVPVGRLGALLAALVAAWSRDAARGGLAVALDMRVEGPQGDAHPWPADPGPPTMPREMQLAVYRISQEALTNVARHAQAGRARLSLRLAMQDRQAVLDWQVHDDGIGLADPAQAMQRGNGLAGMRERAWAQGAELAMAAVHPGAARPGLRLSARFTFELDAPSAAALPMRDASA